MVCLRPCLFLFRLSLDWMSCLSLTRGTISRRIKERASLLVLFLHDCKVYFISPSWQLDNMYTFCSPYMQNNHWPRTTGKKGIFKSKVKGAQFSLFVKRSKVARVTIQRTVCVSLMQLTTTPGLPRKKEKRGNSTFAEPAERFRQDDQQRSEFQPPLKTKRRSRGAGGRLTDAGGK